MNVKLVCECIDYKTISMVQLVSAIIDKINTIELYPIQKGKNFE